MLLPLHVEGMNDVDSWTLIFRYTGSLFYLFTFSKQLGESVLKMFFLYTHLDNNKHLLDASWELNCYYFKCCLLFFNPAVEFVLNIARNDDSIIFCHKDRRPNFIYFKIPRFVVLHSFSIGNTSAKKNMATVT